MNRFLFTIITIALVPALIQAQLPGPNPMPDKLKIGVVNSEMVMQAYPEFRRAEEQLGREVEGWRSERTNWEAQMEIMQKDLIEREKKLLTGQNIFSEKRKMELMMQLDSLKVTYQENLNRQVGMEQERFNQRRMELLAEVLETVNKSIEEIGEQQGFDLILDGANGNVVYARDPEDITDQLLNLLENK